MDKLVIGAWQGVCKEGDVEANLARTQQAIDEAAEGGCDFLCMPELFLCGGNTDDQVRCAMPLDDPRLAALARMSGASKSQFPTATRAHFS